MMKPGNIFLLSLVITGLALTGAFAQGTGEGPGKPGMSVKETIGAPGGPGQGPGAPGNAARDQDSRRERDKAVRDFQKAVRDAERKFSADQKAASKLQGDKRGAAMQKAAEEMKASIKKAEKDKDAVMGERGPGKRKPGRRMGHPPKDTGENPAGVQQDSAGPAVGQLKDDTKSPPDLPKN